MKKIISESQLRKYIYKMVIKEMKEMDDDKLKKIAKRKFEECCDDYEVIDSNVESVDAGDGYGWISATCDSEDGWHFGFEANCLFTHNGDDWDVEEIEDYEEIEFETPDGEKGKIK